MRQLSRTMVTAVENERKRLSRELHDEFLQSLVALKIRVKLLASEPAEEDRERERALIGDEIHDTIRGVKRMIRGLLPPELEHRRLSSALASVFRDIREVYGFTVTRASIRRTANWTRMRVAGFEFDGHVGLTSMHGRAALVGGGITVDTAPGKGTTIGPQCRPWVRETRRSPIDGKRAPGR